MIMSKEELDKKLDQLAKKRDHAADVLNKPLLAWTYQREIDELLSMYTIKEIKL